jgi:AcrR family transcriptional regulator
VSGDLAKMALTRQQQKEKTKTLLVSAGLEIFAKNGIQSTKTLDIAKKVGVSHGTVFVHFPTKKDLLIEIIDGFGRSISEEFKKLSADAHNLRKILKIHLKVIEKHENFYARLLIENALLPGEVRGTLINLQTGIAYFINSAARNEMKAGDIQTMPSHLLFNTWMGLISYYLLNKDIFAGEKSVIKTKGNEILNHFLKLIKL